jgi:hypothetical protein
MIATATSMTEWTNHTVSADSETAWMNGVEYENCGQDGWRPTGRIEKVKEAQMTEKVKCYLKRLVFVDGETQLQYHTAWVE